MLGCLRISLRGRVSQADPGVGVMTHLETQIAELETKAAEFVLLAKQAADTEAQELNTRIAQELYSTVDVLKRRSRLAPSAQA
jgi:hypothetical protein